MTSSTLGLSNLVAFSLQTAIVIAVGALLPWLLRLRIPAVRYAWWRGLLAAILILPLVQPWSPAAVPVGSVEIDVAATAADDRETPEGAGFATRPPATVLLFALTFGAVGRLAWLAMGMMRLRRLRQRGVADAGDEFADIQRRLGTRAELRYVDELRQPATFGLRRPVLLLPASLRGLPSDVRRTVVVHELLHVRRRDWAWVVAEEIVRSLCWFHPAVRWLISRVQLAREEVVDRLTVQVTGTRRSYMKALLTYAGAPPAVPAAPFAKRRHLLHRMLLISQEAVMSSKRLALYTCAMTLAVVATAILTVRTFPLEARAAAVQHQTLDEMLSVPAGALEVNARHLANAADAPRRIVYVPPDRPADAVLDTVAVTFQVTVDAVGEVAEVRLRNVQTQSPESDGRADARALPFVRAALNAVQQWQYEPLRDGPVTFRVVINFPSASGVDSRVLPPPPPPPPPPGTGTLEADGALRVGGAIRPPTKVKDVRPVYPPEALRAGTEGVVVVNARIGPDGRVTDVQVLRSVPGLDQAAMDAVRQWEFTPTLLNGQAVPVIMTMTVNFTLQ